MLVINIEIGDVILREGDEGNRLFITMGMNLFMYNNFYYDQINQ